AVGVEDGEFALQGAKGHQLVAEVFHRLDPTRGDFPAPGDVEPAGGFHGDILDHGASGMSVGGWLGSPPSKAQGYLGAECPRVTVAAAEKVNIAEGNIGGDVLLVGEVLRPQGDGGGLEPAAQGDVHQGQAGVDQAAAVDL